MKISWCVFLVSLPSVLPFGIFGGYVQLLFRWRDGTVSYFPPKNGCNFYQGCYPEYQRLPNGWPLFDKPIAPNIVFREPSFRPWTKIDTILFPAVAHNPATPSTTTETITTEALPEIPVRSLIPDFLTTKADEENVIKGGRKGQPTTPPPILRPTPTPANTAKFTPPPPIVRRPTTPKESPAVNNVDEEVPPKRYTPPPPIQRPTRPTKAADEGGIAAAGYAFVAEDFSTTTTRPSKTIGGRPLISWEQNRFPMPRTTRRPTPRRRTTNLPPTTTEPTTQSNTKVPKDGGRVFIEHWTKTHERTSPKPIYNN